MSKAHIYGGPSAFLAGVPAIYFQMGLPDNTPVDRLSRLIPATGALTCSEFAAKLQRSSVGYRVLGVPLATDLLAFPQRQWSLRRKFVGVWVWMLHMPKEKTLFKHEPEYDPWLRERIKSLKMEEKIRMG